MPNDNYDNLFMETAPVRPLFNPEDWYWRKENGAVYSTRANTLMEAAQAAEDQDYQAWLTQGNIPTPYPKNELGGEDPEELQKVLEPYGFEVYPLTRGRRIRRIHEALAEIDAKSTRPLRAIADGAALDDDHLKIAELNARAVSLRQELAALQEE